MNQISYHYFLILNIIYPLSVKLMLMPSGQVVTIACTLGKTLESLKTHFASELKMSSSLIMMTFDGNQNLHVTLPLLYPCDSLN